MSIATVCAAIKAILDGQTVTVGSETYTIRAFDPPPAKLDTADLPACYAFTGTASNDWPNAMSDDYREARLYRVQCAVLPEGQATPELREARVRPMIVWLRDRLASYPILRTSDASVLHVERTLVMGDSGIAILPEWDGKFIGFEVRLQVTELVTRTYAALN
jgi:hypothetical protein